MTKELSQGLSQGLSQESLDTLDFVPTEAELAHVNRMADDVIRTLDNKDKFYGRRNRSAQKRMNRPHKADAMNKGADMINRLIEKGIVLSKPMAAGVSSETQGM